MIQFMIFEHRARVVQILNERWIPTLIQLFFKILHIPLGPEERMENLSQFA